jgi:hypothetical protein
MEIKRWIINAKTKWCRRRGRNISSELRMCSMDENISIELRIILPRWEYVHGHMRYTAIVLFVIIDQYKARSSSFKYCIWLKGNPGDATTGMVFYSIITSAIRVWMKQMVGHSKVTQLESLFAELLIGVGPISSLISVLPRHSQIFTQCLGTKSRPHLIWEHYMYSPK